MSTNNKKKSDQLGMPHGTACNRLRKTILFDLAQKLGATRCFRCGKDITNVDEFSIDHKEDWLDSDDPKMLFFDIDNIAFSHLSCNVAARRTSKYGSEEERLEATRRKNRESHKRNYCKDKRREKYLKKGY